MTDVLPESHRRAAVELVGYFTGAFGNEVRIDYGTGLFPRGPVAAVFKPALGSPRVEVVDATFWTRVGHELAFVAWMTCLLLIGVVGPADHQALVLTVFVKYGAIWAGHGHSAS